MKDSFGYKFPDWILEDAIYVQLNTKDEIAEKLAAIPEGSPFALDTETTSLDRLKAKILGYSFCNEEGVSYWVPVKTGEELAILAEYVKDRTCLFFNAGYDIPVLENHNVMISKFEDVQCLVFLENPNKRMRGLKQGGKEILRLDTVELSNLFPARYKNIKFNLLDPDVQRLYGCQDADLTYRLFEELSYIKEEQPKIWGLEMALVRPLFQMEFNGVRIDAEFLSHTSEIVRKKIDAHTQSIYDHAGERFDINSHPQISRILYQKLGLSCPAKTAKGNNKTDRDTLKLIKGGHPILAPLREVGSLQSKLTSFIDKLPRLVNSDTEHLHCDFIQWHTPTGRLSSRKPNLMNVPKSMSPEEIAGYENIRAAFIANASKEANDDPQDDDFKFLDTDYSQVELRVAASLAQEPVWLEAYLGDIDVHMNTAKLIYGGDNITERQRFNAKQGNFSILTDITAYTFAQKFGMTTQEAEDFIDKWYEALPRLKEWKHEEKMKAKRTGYAYTYFGRRRPMYRSEADNINCDNLARRRFWERSVISHEVQGGAADIMKLALILLRKKINAAGLANDILPILTVHDQVLFRIRMRVFEEAKILIRNAMEIKISGWVPLKLDMKEGTRWGLCK